MRTRKTKWWAKARRDRDLGRLSELPEYAIREFLRRDGRLVDDLPVCLLADDRRNPRLVAAVWRNRCRTWAKLSSPLRGQGRARVLAGLA